MRLIRKIPFVCTVVSLISVSASANRIQECRIEVPQSIQLEGERFSLAELLPLDACTPVLLAARQVSLGKLPRTGITRVLDGADVRQRFRAIASNRVDDFKIQVLEIPERVLVTRSGPEHACAELAGDLLANAQTKGLDDAVKCGLGALRDGVRLELVNRQWDPALQSWDFVARCATATDCVPFLIRVERKNQLDGPAVPGADRGDRPRVHGGEKTEVIWNEGGLRLVLPGTALAAGRDGDTIRVRLKAGRIVAARITNAGLVLSHL